MSVLLAMLDGRRVRREPITPPEVEPMPDDHSSDALGDMLERLVGELEARVDLAPDVRNVVVVAMTLAANSGRVIGASEVAAQSIQQGFDLRLDMGLNDAPTTLAEVLDR